MKEAIKEFLEPCTNEKSDLWKDAIFIFDTNVYLNLYRYSKETRDSLLKAFEKMQDHLWMPHQVALEFMTRRPEIIFECVERYNKLKKSTNDFMKDIKSTLKLSKDKEIDKFEEQILGWLEEKKDEDIEVEHPNDDNILKTLMEYYHERVGVAYSDEKMNEIEVDGKKRYEDKIPPGYMDAKKDKPYGDLILWKQILDYAAKVNKPVIFITDDQKEDWWLTRKGKTIGIRVELRKEFMDITQNSIILYTMNGFLEIANKKMKYDISENALYEVKNADYWIVDPQYEDRNKRKPLFPFIPKNEYNTHSLHDLEIAELESLIHKIEATEAFINFYNRRIEELVNHDEDDLEIDFMLEKLYRERSKKTEELDLLMLDLREYN